MKQWCVRVIFKLYFNLIDLMRGLLSWSYRSSQTKKNIFKIKGIRHLPKINLKSDIPSINLENDIKMIADNYLKFWLKLMNNYSDVIQFRQKIRRGEILAHKFSSLPFRCHGCGSFFHTNKKDKRGYLTDDQLFWLMRNALSFHDLCCENCQSNDDHKLHQIITKEEYVNELTFLNSKPTLYFHVIDVCDIEGSFQVEYNHKIHPESHVLFVVNKIDRLPGDVVTLKELDHTMKDLINQHEKWDTTQIIDTVYVSCKYFFGATSLFKLLSQISLDRDVCIVGKNNSGKSSLFNLIQNVIHLCKHRENKLLPIQSTVGSLAGTTCGLIRHPINSRYFHHGYKYLRSLFLKEKEIDNFGVNKEINSQFKCYSVDPNLKAEIYGYNPLMSTDKSYKQYIESCCESNAKDHVLFHQANTIYSSRPRVNYLNPNHEFDHNKYSWIYDTPSFSNNVECEKLYAKYLRKETLINENNVKLECLQNTHLKLRSDSVICVDNLISIQMDETVQIKTLFSDKQSQNNGESNHLDIFFFTPPELKIELYLEPKNLNKNFSFAKQYNFEFVGQGYAKTACEINLNPFGWMTILGPSGSLIKLAVSTLNNSIVPSLRTISLLKRRPKHQPSKPLLAKYYTGLSLHLLERKIEPSLRAHHEISFNQRQKQIELLKNHLMSEQHLNKHSIDPPRRIVGLDNYIDDLD